MKQRRLEMNSYELSRAWFDYSFSNPNKIKPIHSSIYFFAIEHCNRLGWKDNFGFPSQMVMEAIGVKNWRTYSKALNDLVDWGFIKMIEKSKNQYSSNIIAIVKNTKAQSKALDKALQKHSTKHSQSTVSINKQLNNITIELINKNASLVNERIKFWIESETKEDKLTFEQRKKKFLIWFNEQKKVYTGRKGSTKQMTPTDDNNLKKLLKAYEHEDFKIALSNMYKSQWAKENNMRTVSHFVRIENFNKYLEQGDTDQSKIAIFPDPVN